MTDGQNRKSSGVTAQINKAQPRGGKKVFKDIIVLIRERRSEGCG